MSLWSKVWRRFCKKEPPESGVRGRKDVGAPSAGEGAGNRDFLRKRSRVCSDKMRKRAPQGDPDENGTVLQQPSAEKGLPCEGESCGWVRKPGG